MVGNLSGDRRLMGSVPVTLLHWVSIAIAGKVSVATGLWKVLTGDVTMVIRFWTVRTFKALGLMPFRMWWMHSAFVISLLTQPQRDKTFSV